MKKENDMNRGKLPAWTAFAFATSLSTCAVGAMAADMKVYSPIVERGVFEAELRGFRDYDKRPALDKNQEYKLGIGYGFTDWLAIEAYGEFEKEKSEGKLELEAHEIEALFQLTPQG